MSKVTEEIKVAQELVKTTRGTFEYLKGSIAERIKAMADHLQDIQGYSDEFMVELINNYVGSKLTPSQCSAAIAVAGLHGFIAQSADAGNMNEFERQYENGIITDPMPKIIEFKYAAKKRIAVDVVTAYKQLATNQANTKEVKIQALMDFGIPEEDAKRYQWSGGTVVDQSGRGVNFYALAGLIIDYPDLLGQYGDE